MYCYNFVTVLMLVAVVCANEDFKLLDSIHQEAPCSTQGGICTIAADCPEGHLVEEKGLCPLQRSMGVECCYGSSVKETRCQKRGGNCFPGKSPCAAYNKFEATDCPEGTACCILVQ